VLIISGSLRQVSPFLELPEAQKRPSLDHRRKDALRAPLGEPFSHVRLHSWKSYHKATLSSDGSGEFFELSATKEQVLPLVHYSTERQQRRISGIDGDGVSRF